MARPWSGAFAPTARNTWWRRRADIGTNGTRSRSCSTTLAGRATSAFCRAKTSSRSNSTACRPAATHQRSTTIRASSSRRCGARLLARPSPRSPLIPAASRDPGDCTCPSSRRRSTSTASRAGTPATCTPTTRFGRPTPGRSSHSMPIAGSLPPTAGWSTAGPESRTRWPSACTTIPTGRRPSGSRSSIPSRPGRPVFPPIA